MHNWYFIEVYNGKDWERTSYYEAYLEFDDAVKSAEEYLDKYSKARIIDECYGIVHWEGRRAE